MSWQLRWGESEEYLLGLADEMGEIAPCLLEKPDLPVHLYPIWKAFGTLSSSRPSGFDAGSITYSEMVCYHVHHKDEMAFDLDEFTGLIQVLDNEYLAFFRDKQKKEQQIDCAIF